MEKTEAYEVPSEVDIVGDMEALQEGLPFEDYAKDEKKLREIVRWLEKEYDNREKIINKIMEYGTGIESEKALRMYPTFVLQKWESSLESFRQEKLKKH
jgi:hypothetical protein